MSANSINYLTYISILREELLPATGCTEPIALAYAAARLRTVLGAMPERICAEVSGNIIKNVKSVVVPDTGGLKGIRAAVAAGVVAGDAEKVLQVISSVPAEKHEHIAAYAQTIPALQKLQPVWMLVFWATTCIATNRSSKTAMES